MGDIEGSNEYDMTFNTFSRLNFWLWNADQAQSKEDLKEWKACCEVLYKEVYPWLKTRKELLPGVTLPGKPKMFKEINEKLIIDGIRKSIREKWGLAYKEVLDNKTKNTTRIFTPNQELIDALLRLEIEIRIVLDREGILTKKKEGSYGSMLG